MPSNTRKSSPHRPSSSKSVAEISKTRTRKIPYRVGYNWNRGGRLKELRIRHLARKFLKIWMQNTFGHILPHKARLHYASVVLRKTFEGWRDVWWSSRRGWDIRVRAECHHKYHLCRLILCHWKVFMDIQREKRQKIEQAQSFADKQIMCRVLEKWEVFTEMKRIKNMTLEQAIEQNKRSILRSAWSLWQTRLQQHRDVSVLEDQALQHRALYPQHWAWLQWKSRRERESKASHHFIFTLKRKSFLQWMTCISSQNEKKSQAVAHFTLCPHQMKTSLRERNSETERLQLSTHSAVQNSQREPLQGWRANMSLSREEAEREQKASRQHHLHLMRAGLRGLSLNATLSKDHRLNNHLALQHYQQTIMRKYWKLWEDCLEEAHSESVQSLIEMALTNYSTLILSSHFHHWRRKPGVQRLTQAILHEERYRLRGAWDRWRQRIAEEQKRQVSDRKNREQQTCRQGDLCSMRWTVDKWRKFVQNRRIIRSRFDQLQRYHEDKLVRNTFCAWKKHHILMSQAYDHADELYKERIQCLLRKVLSQWRKNAALLVEFRLSEQKAKHQFEHFLQVKVFLAWRQTTHAGSRHQQQREAHCSTQSSTNQGTLPRQSGNQSGEARRDRMCVEKAQKHYNSKLLSKALQAWQKHHSHYNKYKVMKRQGIMLLRLKMYQRYFDLWRVKLQDRRREALQTVDALWHWADTLEAKVLCAWRLWVVERRRKRALGDQLLATYARMFPAYKCLPTTTQHSQEPTPTQQESQHIDRVVRRCALLWKERALSKKARKGMLPCQKKQARERLPKKRVAYHLPGPETVSSADSCKQEEEEGMHTTLLPTRSPRRQPRRRAVQSEPPLLAQKHNSAQRLSEEAVQISKPGGHDATAIRLTSSHRGNNTPATSSSEPLSPLLTPSAFMSKETKMMWGMTSSSTLHSACAIGSTTFTNQEMNQSASSKESKYGPNDQSSSLKRELLSIKGEMKAFIEDKNQVEMWREMKDVFQRWLDTSGKHHEERDTICQEVKKLDEDILRLSTDLATQRPLMLLHAERIQQLHNAFIATGAYSPSPVRGDGQQRLFLQDVSPSAASTSKPHTSALDSSQMTPSQDLLPPSAFMSTDTQEMFGKISYSGPKDASAGFLKKSSSTYPGLNQMVSSKETEDAATDPLLSLKQELLSIKQEMETYLADRRQIELWQQEKDVFQRWLETSGKEHAKREAVYQELNELDKQIQRLSADLAKRRRPILHAERIQQLRSGLISTGVYSPSAVGGVGEHCLLLLQDVSSVAASTSNPYTSALDSSQMTKKGQNLPPSAFMSRDSGNDCDHWKGTQ